MYPKNAYFPIYLLRNPINMCSNPENRAHFSNTIDLRGHMPRFTVKMNVFPSISLESPKMCVETLTNRAQFSEMINLRGHMPRLYSKNVCFPIYLLGNCINECWNPQNRVHFIFPR